MPDLDEGTKGRVVKAFEGLTGKVRLVFFERTLGCETCADARRLVAEVASLSDRIEMETYNLAIDRETAAGYRIEDVPALVVMGEKDAGIRFYGTPAGYEFGTLIEAIQDVSAGRIALKPSTIEALRSLAAPVHLRVFVTPT